MGTLRSTGADQGDGPPPGAAHSGQKRPRSRPSGEVIPQSKLVRTLHYLEAAAPFAAGGILIASGTASALQQADIIGWGGPMAGAHMPTSLLVVGAGAGIMVASW